MRRPNVLRCRIVVFVDQQNPILWLGDRPLGIVIGHDRHSVTPTEACPSRALMPSDPPKISHAGTRLGDQVSRAPAQARMIQPGTRCVESAESSRQSGPLYALVPMANTRLVSIRRAFLVRLPWKHCRRPASPCHATSSWGRASLSNAQDQFSAPLRASLGPWVRGIVSATTRYPQEPRFSGQTDLLSPPPTPVCHLKHVSTNRLGNSGHNPDCFGQRPPPCRMGQRPGRSARRGCTCTHRVRGCHFSRRRSKHSGRRRPRCTSIAFTDERWSRLLLLLARATVGHGPALWSALVLASPTP